jgi:hypothetical protein
MKPYDTKLKEMIDQQDKINNEVESKITGKNKHGVYHLCIKHGWGVHGPLENRCPSCENETFLYISADDVLTILAQERSQWKAEVLGLEEMKDEDDKGWTPDNQTMEYEEACDIETRNELRLEIRKAIDAL